MLIGIYLCFLHRQAGRQVEFGTLFKGVDQFAEGLVAYLVMIGFSILASMVTVGLFLVVALAAFALAAGTMEGGAAAGVGIGLGILIYIVCFVVLMVISVLINVPFVFAFQLIADRKLTGFRHRICAATLVRFKICPAIRGAGMTDWCFGDEVACLACASAHSCVALNSTVRAKHNVRLTPMVLTCCRMNIL